MALTLDATSGGANSNAYASVAAADLLASYRVGAAAAAFTALTSDQKIQTLVTACRDIDSISHLVNSNLTEGTHVEFLGERATDTQHLEWPRQDVDGYDANELPSRLVEANIELAISYASLFAAGITTDPLNADAAEANIKRSKTDVLETEYFAPAADIMASALERFPAVVQRLLAPLLQVVEPSSGTWGTGTASRGS